jgi:MFS transporter, OPA family, sugar phosphate sensor protein UhpC
MSATKSGKSNELMLTFGLFVGYGLYSLLRKSYSVALPLMRATLSLSKTDVGNIATSFSVAYGISKFIGGVVSDFLPPEAMFAVGLFLTALSNVFFSLSTSTTVLCIFWFFNGAVQGNVGRTKLNHHFSAIKDMQFINLH